MLVSFLAVLGILIGIGWLSSRAAHPAGSFDYLLDGRRLGPIAVGLSAGATANSGFVMLGAVGLGYSFGMTWVLLPVAWLLGDLVFWKFFPERINRLSRTTTAFTLPGILITQDDRAARLARSAIAALLILIITIYGASQALAGGKALLALFSVPIGAGAALTLALVAIYSLWGGFRASVWTDILQAALMIVVTASSLLLVSRALLIDAGRVESTLGASHFIPFHQMGLSAALIFFVGWGAAALGFGLSQPQVITRYLAARDEAAVRRAKWVYLSFVQFTWVGMTLFGVLARGLVPAAEDPELVLITYSLSVLPDAIVGIVAAAIFAAVASTVDSIGNAIAGMFSCDIVPKSAQTRMRPRVVGIFSAVVAFGFMYLISIGARMNVFQLSVLPVELIAGSVAPALALRLLLGITSSVYLSSVVVSGLVGVIAWRLTGFESTMSSATVGLLVFSIFAGLHFARSPRASRVATE